MRGGAKYRSALNAAVFQGFWDIIEVLVEGGARPDSQVLPESDEAWLAGIREKHDRGAVEWYRKFWEKHKGETVN